MDTSASFVLWHYGSLTVVRARRGRSTSFHGPSSEGARLGFLLLDTVRTSLPRLQARLGRWSSELDGGD